MKGEREIHQIKKKSKTISPSPLEYEFKVPQQNWKSISWLPSLWFQSCIWALVTKQSSFLEKKVKQLEEISLPCFFSCSTIAMVIIAEVRCSTRKERLHYFHWFWDYHYSLFHFNYCIFTLFTGNKKKKKINSSVKDITDQGISPVRDGTKYSLKGGYGYGWIIPHTQKPRSGFLLLSLVFYTCVLKECLTVLRLSANPCASTFAWMWRRKAQARRNKKQRPLRGKVQIL